MGMALSRVTFPDSTRMMEAAVAPVTKREPRMLSGPILFIECTHTYQHDLNTGIQRVVRNILRHSTAIAATYGLQVVPVVLENGRFLSADAQRVLMDKQRPTPASSLEPSLVAAPEADLELPPGPEPSERRPSPMRALWHLALRVLATLLPFEGAHRFLYAPPDRFGLAHCLSLKWIPVRRVEADPAPMPEPIQTSIPIVPDFAEPVSLDEFDDLDGCLLLLLDSSWPTPIWPAVARFKARGGYVAGVIYDLIPITHSNSCVSEVSTVFTAWIRNHLSHSDALVCISRSVAAQLKTFFRSDVETRAFGDAVPIDHFHLGSELDLINPVDGIRPEVRAIFEATGPIFLMVGSIEPRKNHAYVLDAFDRFWCRGGAATLVIVGRREWKTEAVLARIAEHRQLGRQLFILRDLSDLELDHGYRHASALVMASQIEGFGLPIVEAFQHGLPILCSDIPVFREIADRRATFFDLAAPDHLTDAVENFCRWHDRWNRWICRPRQWLDRHNDPLSRALRAPYRAIERRRQARRSQQWLSWRESTEQLISAVMRRRAPVENEPNQDNAPSIQSMA